MVLDQTLPPAVIWACFLGCENDELIKTYKKLTKDCEYAFHVESNYNFKYIGRYQLALTAPTDYVITLDDDRLPHKDYCQTMVEILQQEDCLVQQYGWKLDMGENLLTNISPDRCVEGICDMRGTYYRPVEAGNHRFHKKTPTLSKVDYLCGGIAFRKSSLRYLFQEDIYTAATGEDIMFCLRCQKNGVPTYAYHPNIEAKPNQFLGHDSMEINFTTDNTDVILFRTNIIKKELEKTDASLTEI